MGELYVIGFVGFGAGVVGEVWDGSESREFSRDSHCWKLEASNFAR